MSQLISLPLVLKSFLSFSPHVQTVLKCRRPLLPQKSLSIPRCLPETRLSTTHAPNAFRSFLQNTPRISTRFSSSHVLKLFPQTLTFVSHFLSISNLCSTVALHSLHQVMCFRFIDPLFKCSLLQSSTVSKQIYLLPSSCSRARSTVFVAGEV